MALPESLGLTILGLGNVGIRNSKQAKCVDVCLGCGCYVHPHVRVILQNYSSCVPVGAQCLLRVTPLIDMQDWGLCSSPSLMVLLRTGVTLPWNPLGCTS